MDIVASGCGQHVASRCGQWVVDLLDYLVTNYPTLVTHCFCSSIPLHVQ